jgi:hypothetical protein
MPKERPALNPGDTGSWVNYLQEMINFYYRQSGKDVVTVNGTFDATTANAVQHFRKQHHLAAGQHVDATFWSKLESGAAPEPTGSVTTAKKRGSSWRSMADVERQRAFQVFGSALAMDDVQLSEGGVMTLGGYSRTLPDHIYFETGHLQQDPSLLIHELGHVWQYQQGASVIGLACSALDGDYDYGGEQGLRDAHAKGQPFWDFGYEEQAQILQDYSRASGDTSAFDPYIRSVRHGTYQQPPP